jgi:hypothetical protein
MAAAVWFNKSVICASTAGGIARLVFSSHNATNLKVLKNK